jgi:hypothetical protein
MVNIFKSLMKYTASSYCENCGHEIILRIPRGVYIYDHLKQDKALCPNCRCAIKKLINEDIKPEELEKKHREELRKLREKLKNE